MNLRLILLILGFFAHSCGDFENLDKKANLGDIPKISEHQRLQHKWDRLAAYLKIGNNKPAEDESLIEHLSKPTAFVSDPSKSGDYQKILREDIEPAFLSDAPYLTRCNSIIKFKPVADATTKIKDADLFHMQYILQASAEGDPQNQVRNAIVSIPKSQKNEKLDFLSYAHPGDNGYIIQYDNFALKALQGSHVVLAPAFAGEPICVSNSIREAGKAPKCKSGTRTIAEAIGSSNPWFDDVNDIIGLQDCAQKAVFAETVPKMAKNHFIRSDASVAFVERLKASYQDLSPTMALGLPAYTSKIMGSSRGGLVASLAVAKSGLMWNTASASPTNGPPNIGPAYTHLLTIAAPTNITMGQMRLVFEQIVRGTFEHTTASQLPGLHQLQTQFKIYRDDLGEDQNTLRKAAKEVMIRDLSYLLPFVYAGLRDFRTPVDSMHKIRPGKHVMIHGDKDAVVPFDQSIAVAQLLHNFDKVVPALTGGLITEGLASKLYIVTKIDTNESLFHLDADFFGSRMFIEYQPSKPLSLQDKISVFPNIDAILTDWAQTP